MKKLLTVLFLTSIFVLGMNITRAESTSVNIDDTRACTLEYMPVCGEIQVYCIKAPCPPIRTTYGNKCMADAAGAKIISQGECATPSTKPCTDEYMPVCGSDGETYGNKCVADAAGAKIVSQGECVALPTKACTKEYMPVCGSDGETYGNKCVADAAGAKIVYSGECVGERGDINPGEGTVYRNVASLLDKSYLAWKYTPIQAYNYTQTIVDKIDNLLQTSKLKPLAYNKYVQIKRLLQVYMKVEHILE